MNEYEVIYQIKTGYEHALIPVTVDSFMGLPMPPMQVMHCVSNKIPDVPYSLTIQGRKARVHQIARPGTRYRSTQREYLL